MSLAEGGWTLVGRSSPNGFEPTFGWRASVGTVSDASSPYSVNAETLAPFTEVLVGSKTAGVWERAYTMHVRPDFLETTRERSISVLPVTVAGDCAPPNMLTNIGQTNLVTGHFLRDKGYEGFLYGLGQSGFNLHDYPCQISGLLHDRQGEIYVR